ncbi:proteasome regulatory particle base subunit [Blastocladiella emersonii ATCC 22665]|nr:proteasome regulatory particle base subunit [Blastocladiella emersonii ATCC 22665]
MHLSALRPLAATALLLAALATVATALSADVTVAGASSQAFTAAPGSPFAPLLALSADHTVTVKLADLASPSAPVHAMAVASASGSGGERPRVYAVPVARSGKSVTLNLAALDAPAGTYTLSLASATSASDAVVLPLATRVAWKPRDLDADHPRRALAGPLPVIHHRFRDDTHNPRTVLSAVFAFLLTVPALAVLNGVWLATKSPLPMRVTAKSASFVAVVLLGYPALAFAYWTRLNLLETLPWFAALTAVAVPVGVAALRESAQWHNSKSK